MPMMRVSTAIYSEFFYLSTAQEVLTLCSLRVYATDMSYSVFKDDPLNSSEGRRYLHTIIGRGASKDEMETLVEFLGREPGTEAFYKELGLS